MEESKAKGPVGCHRADRIDSGSLRWGERKRQRILEEITAESCPNLVTVVIVNIQGAQQIPNR